MFLSRRRRRRFFCVFSSVSFALLWETFFMRDFLYVDVTVNQIERNKKNNLHSPRFLRLKENTDEKR